MKQKKFINLCILTLFMVIKNRRWFLLISMSALIGILIIVFFSIFGTSVNITPWGHVGCPYMIPNYILWISFTLMIFTIVPISYYFISQRLEGKLEKNMNVISKLVNKGNSISKIKPKELTDKNNILKFLNLNERKVLEKLIEKKGSVLQSEISRMEGMSKLKAHRTIKELKKRGIINIESYGKTNMIKLSEEIKDIFPK